MTNNISKPVPATSCEFGPKEIRKYKSELKKTREALLTAQIKLLVRERDIKTISQSLKKNIEINKKLFDHLKHINIYVKDEVTNALLLENAPELKMHNHMEPMNKPKQQQPPQKEPKQTQQKEEDTVCEIDNVTAEYYTKMCDWSPPNPPQREMNRYGGNNDSNESFYKLF